MAVLKDGGDASKGDQRGKRGGGTKGQSSPACIIPLMADSPIVFTHVQYEEHIKKQYRVINKCFKTH